MGWSRLRAASNFRGHTIPGSSGHIVAGALVAALLCADSAHAACNIIPSASRSFRGSVGTTDRPFARPGDVVDLSLVPACDTASPGFAATAADNVVTVVFTPPSARANIVVVAADCGALTEAQRLGCVARPDVNSFSCIDANQPGGPADLEVFSRDGRSHLRLRFPDTDELVETANDDHTFAGPAAIAVTRGGDPLPCDLASNPCSAQTGLVACIDTLFASDGTCGTTPDKTFSHFTALPPPNNYQALCYSPVPPCTNAASEVRLTTDADGNLLLPMDWRGILVGQGVPVARLLRGSAPVRAFPAPDPRTDLVRIPGSGFLRAYSPEGIVLPPVFDPQADPTASEATLFGSADAPETMLRIARRSPTFTECHDGGNDGLPCTSPSDCPNGTCGATTCATGTNAGSECHSDDDCDGGECGPSLFEFRSRYRFGFGPLVLPRFAALARDAAATDSLWLGTCQTGTNEGSSCTLDTECPGSVCVGYRLVAQDPVPLEGLNQTTDLNAFVVAEGVDGKDLNGDGDAKDDVIVLADRRTGRTQSIGDGGAVGRATVRIRDTPFSYPAVAARGDTVAFLESEGSSNDPAPPNIQRDENGDGDSFDAILRVFNVNGTEVSAALSPARAVDATPLVNGRSLAIADGKVFVRSSEAAMAPIHVSRVSVSSTGEQGNGHSNQAAVSGDGRWVAFVSYASNLVPDDTNNFCDQGGWGGGSVNCPDVFVHDTIQGTTVRVSVDSDGNQGTRLSWVPSISADGRFVAFFGPSFNLVPPDRQNGNHVYVHDRDLDRNDVFDESTPGATKTTMVDVRSDGSYPSTGISALGFSALSTDGRFILFYSNAQLVDDDTNGIYDLYIRDRDLDGNGIFDEPGADKGLTQRVSLKNDGSQLLYESPSNFNDARMSADGRYIAFGTYSTELLPAGVFPAPTCELSGGPCVIDSECTAVGGASDWCHYRTQQIMLRDRVAGTTEFVSLTSDGNYANGPCFHPNVSNDGRYVYFTCGGAATNLVAGDTNWSRDVFVRDRLRASTQRLSVKSDGSQVFGDSQIAVPSADGRLVAFRSITSDLVPGSIYTGQYKAFVNDRLTGMTIRVSNQPDGADSVGGNLIPEAFANLVSVSGDGSTVVFPSTAADLVTSSAKSNYSCDDDWGEVPPVYNTDKPCSDVFAYQPNAATSGAADLSGNGTFRTTVLEAIDVTTGSSTPLCPATQVALAGGWVTLLRPESAGTTPNIASCPTGALVHGKPDLNGDGDTNDAVIHLGQVGTALQNLGIAAEAVALSAQCAGGTHLGEACVDASDCDGEMCSASWLAATTSEAENGAQDRNGDGDSRDLVVEVHPVGGGAWINTGAAAESVQVCGGRVAFLTPEADQNHLDLNGDGDTQDRVLQLFDPVTETLTNTHWAAEEFVCNPYLLAFRTAEASQDHTDLNGDGDATDSVLEVYDLASNQQLNTGQAVTPCRLEACDPRIPYRVLKDTVKFLTFEGDQSEDLNANGSGTDLVLQSFNVRLAEEQGGATPIVARMSAPLRYARTRRTTGVVAPAAHTTLGSTSAGVCTTSGASCADDSTCGGGKCFVPPGDCVRATGAVCTPDVVSSCALGQFCQPDDGSPSTGTCQLIEPNAAGVPGCNADAECQSGAHCRDAGQDIQRLVAPLAEANGHSLFTSSGLCVETVAPATVCSDDSNCAAGTFCGPAARCQRAQGLCRESTDCPAGASCNFDLLVATDRDSDGDEIPDRFDTCPELPNVEQIDTDGDGAGDACDVNNCGNGVFETGERCDDGNSTDGDGCTSACQTEAGYACTGEPSSCVPAGGLPTATPVVPAATPTPGSGAKVPPDATTLECEQAVANSLRKLDACVRTCRMKAVKAAFKGESFPDAPCVAACRSAYDTTTGGVSGCPACLDSAGLAQQRLSSLRARNGDVLCSAGATPTPLPGGVSGAVPPDANTLKCELATAKNLRKHGSCLALCRIKAVTAAVRGLTFDAEACAHTDPKTSCQTKFNSAAAKLVAKGTCPACLGSDRQDVLRSEIDSEVRTASDAIYCAGTMPLEP